MQRNVYKAGDQVKLNSIILEEDPRKNNHRLYQRIINENRVGEVERLDNSGDWFAGNCYWVKFHYAKILLSEAHMSPSL